MNEDISRKLGQLKINISALGLLAEFYDGLMERRLINKEEVDETKLKIKYAKEQMMGLSLKNKKMLLSIEKEEMP